MAAPAFDWSRYSYSHETCQSTIQMSAGQGRCAVRTRTTLTQTRHWPAKLGAYIQFADMARHGDLGLHPDRDGRKDPPRQAFGPPDMFSGCLRCHGIAKVVENSTGAIASGLRPAMFPRYEHPPRYPMNDRFAEKRPKPRSRDRRIIEAWRNPNTTCRNTRPILILINKYVLAHHRAVYRFLRLVLPPARAQARRCAHYTRSHGHARCARGSGVMLSLVAPLRRHSIRTRS